MTTFQILKTVEEYKEIEFLNLLNTGGNFPGRDYYSDQKRVKSLIGANYLEGKAESHSKIRLTTKGEDFLYILQENENRRIAEEKRRKAFSSQMEELIAAVQSQAKAAEAKAETAQEVAKTAQMHMELAIKEATSAKKDARFSKAVSIISILSTVAALILSYLFGMEYLP